LIRWWLAADAVVKAVVAMVMVEIPSLIPVRCAQRPKPEAPAMGRLPVLCCAPAAAVLLILQVLGGSPLQPLS
jgi:hypothetical protein